MFDDLDKLLETRRTPEVPEGLSARIVAAAHRERFAAAGGDARGGVFWERLRAGVENIFLTPRPVFALVLIILVFGAGLFLGEASEGVDFSFMLSPGEVASFMTIDDRFVVEEWV
ncbi:MAG: hypothetical protein R3E13_05600 [Alphaproteobacteria bacterium]